MFMKFRSVLFTAAMIVFASGVANAAIVNYGDHITGGENVTSSDVISNGQNGSVFISPNAESGGFQAYLANNSTITFSYPFTYILPANSFVTVPLVYATGGVFPGGEGGPNYAHATNYGAGKYNMQFGDVFATANLDAVSITNRSGEVIPFSTSFFGFLQQFSNGAGGTVGKINYSAFDISAVPLPSSVVMFGSAIAALFSFSYLSRQRKGTILQA